jgi:uncharacterized membrane protein YeiH
MIRDVLIREEPIIFKPGQFYAGAAIAGCTLFVVMTEVAESDKTVAAIIATALATTIRLLSVRYNWQTKPVS